jgi:hypothetical protein
MDEQITWNWDWSNYSQGQSRSRESAIIHSSCWKIDTLNLSLYWITIFCCRWQSNTVTFDLGWKSYFVSWRFESGHHIVWYVHGDECFGGACWVCLHRPSDDCSSRSRPNRLCWTFRLHSPITEKTVISNIHIIHFSCIVSTCYKKLTYTW